MSRSTGKYSLHAPEHDYLEPDDSSGSFEDDFIAEQGDFYIPINYTVVCTRESLNWQIPKVVKIPTVETKEEGKKDCCSIEQANLLILKHPMLIMI